MSLDQASAALIGAAIGASAGLLGALVTSWRQSKLEKEKWLRAREDAVRTDTGEALRHLARTLASAAHSMMWATYKAIKYERVGKAELGAYEQEFHEAVADMVSSQMHLAALDRSLFDRVKPLIDDTISIGEGTFEALKSASERSTSEDALRECNRRALELIKRDQTELSEALRDYVLS